MNKHLDNHTIELIMKEKQLKMTKQRRIILDILTSHPNEVLTADELLNYSVAELSTLNLTTVYRNLEHLYEANIIDKISLNSDTMGFKLRCSHEHHHHIICQECHKTKMIDYCPAEAFNLIAEEKGFQITSHRLEIYGICDACREKKEKTI